MKVCMVVHQFYYIDQRVIRYAETLVDKGHSVDVICAHERRPVKHKRVNGPVRVTTIPIAHGKSSKIVEFLLEYSLAFLFYFIVTSWQFLIHRYDVIHVHNMPDFLVFAALFPRIFGAKVILDVHDPVPEFYQTKFKAHEGSNLIKLLEFEERCSVTFANAVICANDNYRDNIISRGTEPGKITVVRNFPDRIVYDREKFSATTKKDLEKFVLIYTGTVAPRYGLDVAIRAVHIVKEEYPCVELRIIGQENEYKQALRDLVESLDVERWVKILPPVAMNEVPAALANADMGVHPAIPDVYVDITIPTKVLEYTVMGLPVIASRLTVIDHLFKDGKVFTFTASNVDECASVIQRCIADRSLVKEAVAINDASLLPYWDWALEKEKYLSLVQDLYTNRV